jgi:transcriptional regulator with XRE-family HTH domain
MAANGQNPTDLHVGSRIRMRRLMRGMSQQTLAYELGITFQQIQKYEKGVNRVSASRLQQISQVLKVPVGFFFEGAAKVTDRMQKRGETLGASDVIRFAATPDGVALAQAFTKIKHPALRRSIVRMVESLALSPNRKI